MMDLHEKFMNRCIALSRKAKRNNYAPVGALIAMDGEIIAESFEGEPFLPPPIAHAEIIAVLKAIEKLKSRDLSNCILYSTKEPCFMCSYLIRQTKIKGIVFASSVEDIGGASSAFPLLKTNTIKKWDTPPFLIEGVLINDYEKLLK